MLALICVGRKAGFGISDLSVQEPTFTGQYLRWNSFSSQKRKINLIGKKWLKQINKEKDYYVKSIFYCSYLTR